jgi:hypothetical protein
MRFFVPLCCLCLAACFEATDTEGLPCNEDAACYDGQVCSAESVCVEPEGGDGDGDGDVEGIVIYRQSEGWRGDFTNGGMDDVRLEADDACSDERPAGCTQAVAILAVSEDDDLASLASNHGVPAGTAVVGPMGAVIADDWDAFLAGELELSLFSAGAHQEAPDQHWTGAGADGTFDAATSCDGWTSFSSGLDGVTGVANAADDTWLVGGSKNCNDSSALLCACW